MDAGAHVPDGFVADERDSPATNAWKPIYRRMAGDTVIIGLRVTSAHTNSRGFVHGGLISALADNAMGHSCASRIGPDSTLVTVSLTVDFLGPAFPGQWLEFDTVFVKPGGTLCFTQAFVTADGQPCARTNGVFRVVRQKMAA
ncbi:PaaI family thioesterase [uncultured Phenylobacterium sp.]|uniref:PaaI family thioesterase n=1 Tax=uncultured Phenylobacterium sp. TaxID=349273 RepID=UPI0025DFD271|nr:PaaI family thioesterase [uncultured Phenylobacterium sp.]